MRKTDHELCFWFGQVHGEEIDRVARSYEESGKQAFDIAADADVWTDIGSAVGRFVPWCLVLKLGSCSLVSGSQVGFGAGVRY